MPPTTSPTTRALTTRKSASPLARNASTMGRQPTSAARLALDRLGPNSPASEAGSEHGWISGSTRAQLRARNPARLYREGRASGCRGWRGGSSGTLMVTSLPERGSVRGPVGWGSRRGPSTIDVSPLLFQRDDVPNFRRATARLGLTRERAFCVSVKLHKPPRNERDQPPEQDRDRKGAAISSCSFRNIGSWAPRLA